MKYLPRIAYSLAVLSGILLSVQAQPAKNWENYLFGQGSSNKPILRYVNANLPADETKPAVQSVGYLHPVYTPSGELVTDLAPTDHPHHRGIFCAWIEVEGKGKRGDFWGWGAQAPKEGCAIRPAPAPGFSETFRLLASKPRPGDPMYFGWVATSSWRIRDTEILFEVLTLRLRHLSGPKGELPPADGPPEWQAYIVDLHYVFVNPGPPEVRTGDVRLGGNPFGGFCYQAKPRGKPEITGPDGKVVTWPDAVFAYAKPAKNWPAAKWYDLTYRSEDGKKVSGVAVMDHPANPKTTWHNNRSMHLINPCIVADDPVTIKDSLALRYRLVIHDGEAAAVPLAKLHQEFADPN